MDDEVVEVTQMVMSLWLAGLCIRSQRRHACRVRIHQVHEFCFGNFGLCCLVVV
ncbi:hypothetical protein HanXRQr2_Chr12g0557461 [Helianthus annuus]|uniref:Uncharacterized protein n=1 Tax=Helianthus annuus TaxID=4232 RepID=A0A9K3HJ35_HELAN|nr:hypothetical protein HanXRQr2_Chr12g0557461 [Helianthus annuus]KAJ0864005.1 hypothetical protein HanPSC8_Chr12g0536681 [Helianthus annuus]